MDCDTIQVAIRIRPLIESELDRGNQDIVSKIPNEPQIVVNNSRNNIVYTFDHVFGQTDDQNRVFDECVEKRLDKLFEGYNVTILAYGQTGSGKTHTMGTAYKGNTTEDVGVIPRAVSYIFEQINELTESKEISEVSTACSFVELYKEDLFDLLSSKSRKNSILEVREDKNGQLHTGTTACQIKGVSDVMQKLLQGTQIRAVGATSMNAESSRSHVIFSLLFKFKRNNSVITSKFNLVDLAGSERSSKTKAIGERLREGILINQGLLSLSKVITALGSDNPSGFVGYRDSKLTRLLQDSLGGNSFTLMIACVSPADSNFEETVSTLRYADQAKKIKNKPIINYDPRTAEINRLEQTVKELADQINAIKHDGSAAGKLLKTQTNSKTKDRGKKFDHELKKIELEIIGIKNQVTEYIAAIFEMESNISEAEISYDSLKTLLSNLIEIVNNFGVVEESHEGFAAIQNLVDTTKDIIATLKSPQFDESNFNTSIKLTTQMTKKDFIETKTQIHQKHLVLAKGQMTMNAKIKLENDIKLMESEIAAIEANTNTLKKESNVTESRRAQLNKELVAMKQNLLQTKKELVEKEKEVMKLPNLQKVRTELQDSKKRLVTQIRKDRQNYADQLKRGGQQIDKLKQKEKQVNEEHEHKKKMFDEQKARLKSQVDKANEIRLCLMKAEEERKTNKLKNIKDPKWFEREVEFLLKTDEAKHAHDDLINSRTIMCDQMRKLKTERELKKDDSIDGEIKALENRLAMQDVEISVLRGQIGVIDLDTELENFSNELSKNCTEETQKQICEYYINYKKSLFEKKRKFDEDRMSFLHLQSTALKCEKELANFPNEAELKINALQAKYEQQICGLIQLNDMNNAAPKDELGVVEDDVDEVEELARQIEEYRNGNRELKLKLKNGNELKDITNNRSYSPDIFEDIETPAKPKRHSKRKTTMVSKGCGCRKSDCGTSVCSCKKVFSVCNENCSCTEKCKNRFIDPNNTVILPRPSVLNGSSHMSSALIKEEAVEEPTDNNEFIQTPKKIRLSSPEQIVTPSYPQRKPFFNIA